MENRGLGSAAAVNIHNIYFMVLYLVLTCSRDGDLQVDDGEGVRVAEVEGSGIGDWKVYENLNEEVEGGLNSCLLLLIINYFVA